MYRPKFIKRLLQYSGWGYPDVLRLRSSLFINCAPTIFFIMVFTALVAVLYEVFGYNVVLPETLLNTVSLVVAILLGFRMTDAFEHYYKCRELFSNMSTEIRNAIRKIWIGVQEIDDRDKKKYIKQLLAFAIAVKHQMRLKYGLNWSDLKELLPDELYIHEAATNQEALRDIAHRVPPIVYSRLRIPYSADRTTIWFGASEFGTEDASMSLPLEIIFHIETYIYKKLKNDSIRENTYDSISENLNSLVGIFSELDKICSLPLPHFYIIHLKQIVFLYVLLLPFALIEQLRWFVIPAVGLVAFILFGLEIIGAAAIQPLGYIDLPLDGFCQELEAEIKFMIRHLSSVKEVSHSIEAPVT